jgi:hypothetical protein
MYVDIMGIGVKLLALQFLQNLLAALHNATLHHGHILTDDPSQWSPPAHDVQARKTADRTRPHRKKNPSHKSFSRQIYLALAKENKSKPNIAAKWWLCIREVPGSTVWPETDYPDLRFVMVFLHPSIQYDNNKKWFTGSNITHIKMRVMDTAKCCH